MASSHEKSPSEGVDCDPASRTSLEEEERQHTSVVENTSLSPTEAPKETPNTQENAENGAIAEGDDPQLDSEEDNVSEMSSLDQKFQWASYVKCDTEAIRSRGPSQSNRYLCVCFLWLVKCVLYL